MGLTEYSCGLGNFLQGGDFEKTAAVPAGNTSVDDTFIHLPLGLATRAFCYKLHGITLFSQMHMGLLLLEKGTSYNVRYF